MPFELVIAEGKGRGQSFAFDASDVTIGRGAENDIVLNDFGVSRMHAKISLQGRDWMLFDNGSSNGTDLNGAQIMKPAALKKGDRIGVGPVVFEFKPAAAADETRIRPQPVAAGNETRVTAKPAAPSDNSTRVTKMPIEQPKTIAPRAGGTPNNVKDLWARLPKAGRIGVIAIAALLVAGIARAAVSGKEHGRGLECPETVAVDDDVASFSFGAGEVDVNCGNKVVFGFNAPAKTRVLFHYTPRKIATPSELELRLNGKHIAWAPVAGSRGEPQTLPLPPEALSTDGRNLVTFTQASKEKEWAVGKVRVELVAVTPGDLIAAKQAYERGRRKLEEKRIAPRNLYDAWKAFTEARRQMEGLSPHPPLYDEVAQLIKDSERELDKSCGKLLFTAARFEKYGQDDRAQQSYREVLMHFPGEDPTGCRKKAQENIVSASADEEQ